MSIEMWLMLGLVVVLSGVSKAAFAGGLGLLAMPLMLVVFDPHTALGIMLPILLMLDGFTLRKYWQRWSLSILWQLLPAAVVGIVVAALLLGSLSTTELQWLIGLGSILFALRYFFFQQQSATWLASRPVGVLMGFLSGISSTLLHAGGPPLAIHLLARKLPATEYIATSAVFFAVLNLVKLPAFVWQQQLTLDLLWLALPFFPLCYLSIKLGYWLKQKVSDKHFLPAVHLLLLLAGGKLIWQAI
ncbi:MAG: sulfite exporter TauE/SafE family protein [Gammaproteobacteria bacterium]|nr:sulfite exporter TauE/SafE family protein [Gammaproteobacteria bacterium]